MQIKASFKKETLGFFRTKVFIILTLVFIGLALFTPLMYKGMEVLMDATGEMVDRLESENPTREIEISESGTGAGETEISLGEQLNAVSSLFSFNEASMGVVSIIGDLAMTGLIVFLLVINRFAGGEQKKRSIIIPRSSGLRNLAYVFPKFVIYPLTAVILSVAATLAAAAASASLAEINDLVMPRVIFAGLIAGLNLAMYVCFHIALGTATGKAGMSAAICIGASIIVPGFFGILSMNTDNELLAYNPFGLSGIAQAALYNTPDLAETFITIAVSVVLMIAAFLLSLFAQNAKTIDNSGNEILI